MPFLVTDSAVPLPAETLPALKLTHYYNAPARGDVYAYLRCYIYKGALCYNLLVFDGAPPPTERIGFALCPAKSEVNFCLPRLAKRRALTRLPCAGHSPAAAMPRCGRFRRRRPGAAQEKMNRAPIGAPRARCPQMCCAAPLAVCRRQGASGRETCFYMTPPRRGLAQRFPAPAGPAAGSRVLSRL